MHKLHENDRQPPRSVAAEWHQVAIERAERIKELEKEVAKLRREVYELEGDVKEAYHPTV